MAQSDQNNISDYLKIFFKKNLAYTFSLIFERSVIFLLLPFYTKLLTPDDYGIYSIFIATVSIGTFLYGLGIENCLIKFKAEENHHPKLDSTIFSGIIFPSLIFTSILILFCSGISSLIFRSSEYYDIIILTGVILFFETLARYFVYSFIGEQKSKVFLIVSFTRGILTICLNVLLVWYFEMGLIGAVWSYLITIFFISSLLVFRKKVILSFSFDKELYIKLFKYSFPVMLTSSFIMMLNFADTYILKYFFDSAEVGKYSASYKFGTGMNLFVTAYSTAIIPFALNLLKKNKEQIKVLNFVFDLFFSLMVLIFVFAGMFYREIINFNINGMFVIDPKFHDAVEIIPVIVFSYIFMGIYTNSTVPFHYNGNTKKLTVITLSAAIINLVLNFIFVPLYSYWGAALVTLVSFLILALMTSISARKIIPIQYNIGKILLLLVTALTLYFISQNLLFDYLFVKILLFILFVLLVAINFKKTKSAFIYG